MELTIRKAIPEEAAALSNIAIKAKAHWGYAKEQLDLWRREFLTVSSDYIRDQHVWVAYSNSQLQLVFQGSEFTILKQNWIIFGYFLNTLAKVLEHSYFCIRPK